MSYEYGYDYDVEPNFPEVEEIIEEAKGKFDDFLVQTFMAEYKDLGRKQAACDKRFEEQKKRSQALEERELVIKQREADLEKSESEQYNKLKLKWFKELGLNFDIGDTVYYCSDIIQRVDCPVCKGKRTVVAVIDGETYEELNCPKCQGYGTVMGPTEYEIKEAVVLEIHAQIIKRNTSEGLAVKREAWQGIEGELGTFVWVRDKKRSNNDSHQFPGTKLYKTREAAQAWIDEQSQGEKK